MDRNEIISLFQEKLNENYGDYMSAFEGSSCEEILGQAEEIAITKQLYKELSENHYNTDHIEYLLKFSNPLNVIRDEWMEYHSEIQPDELASALWNIWDKEVYEADYEPDDKYIDCENIVIGEIKI